MLPRIVLCDALLWSQPEAEQLFKGIADVKTVHDSTSRSDFVASLQPGGALEGAIGLYRRTDSPGPLRYFDKQLIDALPPSVKWIASFGAGYDQVDVAACKERGIRVSNTPNMVDDATATTALYLLISALRCFSKAERDIRAGAWKSQHWPGPAHDVTGRTIAILGLGGIGLRFAELVHAFPMRVLYHSRRRVAHAPEWCEYYGPDRLDEMLAQADVLSVHVPLTEQTASIVDEKMIRKLKRGAVIVNTARGGVIDEDAMMKALEDGHLSAVGLDVFCNEPNINPRWFSLPNATLLPHVGTATSDTRKKMELRALENLRDFITTGMGNDLVFEFK
ncbi:hypothetical protein WOLCODRAFT_167046 [Wolfiporia cocos MD-104 SS10]|uniref:D-isomer specific 2-hydroxyacid dehydrogenase n=1 Tax=Wolfiporia cocos (strain MD-104) TaxID=742152 RepID=A0A2H3JA13_WOLCO|nr:hypothetical protein WOLCODRAFT_167046 [Wolfiporia cocos MD-104 SS10]